MSFIPAVRNQTQLLGYSLEELVPAQAKCRFVVALVKQLDLGALYRRYSHQGAQAYEPAMMLALWFMAYSEGLTSTRLLEERCHRDLYYLWLSAQLKPDHTSLSRFRQQHLDLMRDYFVQIVRLAQQQGLSSFRSIAGDGTRLAASASRRQMRTREQLETSLEAVSEEIGAYLAQCQAEEDGASAVLRRKRALRSRLLERRRQLEARRARLKAEHRSRHQINLVEPEACLLDKVNGSGKQPAYNGQITVDTESQLIAACALVSDRNDQQQLAPLYQQTEANLGPDAGRSYTFDAGYHTLEQLRYVEEAGADVVVGDPHPEQRSPRLLGEASVAVAAGSAVAAGRRFERSAFAYDAETDRYVCPAGEVLPRVGARWQKGHRQLIYEGQRCHGCPLKAHCQPKAHLARRLYRDEREPLAEAMQHRIESAEGRARLKLRRMSVEPVFGQLKSNLGFRRFRLRGLRQAEGEFTLMCIGHNLNKLFQKALDGSFLELAWACILFVLTLGCSWKAYLRPEGWWVLQGAMISPRWGLPRPMYLDHR